MPTNEEIRSSALAVKRWLKELNEKEAADNPPDKDFHNLLHAAALFCGESSTTRVDGTRNAVLGVFVADSQRHLTATDIHDLVVLEIPTAKLATTRSIVCRLCSEGTLRRLNGKYRLAD